MNSQPDTGRITGMALQIKRVYDTPATADGHRVLVDRLWPRGLSKEHAQVDTWIRDIGPSDALRKWFDHDPDKFSEFQERYWTELAENPALEQMRDVLSTFRVVTLVYGAKDEEHNQAVVLRDYLNSVKILE